MKKYAIAQADLYNGENKIKIVEAENPIQAICNATGDCIEEFEKMTLEEIIQTYFDGDVLISEPLELK